MREPSCSVTYPAEVFLRAKVVVKTLERTSMVARCLRVPASPSHRAHMAAQPAFKFSPHHGHVTPKARTA